jgi:hypothetical protein
MLRANAASSSKLKVFRHVVLPLTNHDLKKSNNRAKNRNVINFMGFSFSGWGET